MSTTTTARAIDSGIVLAAGVRLGPYEILGPLGKGGMGEVYRARDTRLDRAVALKVLPVETRQSADHLARLEREARAVAALNHPNILALHDVGTASSIAYVVTELLEGETLRERLRGGRLPPQKAIDIAIQIARGLAAAHERGIVHRDLKPENLFITRDDRVKILDFGLARWETPAGGAWTQSTTQIATTPGIVLGTPGYLAPEQILGEAATPQSDLFAFGVVVHEMLTGAHPFLRSTLTGTFTAVMKDEPPALGDAAASIPAGIAKVLERCLEKHPADRPESARDLALYLQAIAGQSRSQATNALAAGDAARLRRRLLAISCGLLLLLSTLTWTFVHVMAGWTVTAAMDADIARAERAAIDVQRGRLSALSFTSRLVASFPELKALLATDAATVHDFLVSYRQRNADVPLLLALDAAGNVVADTESSANDHRWTAPLLARPGVPAIVEIAGRLYHAAAAPAEAGGNVFGYIVGAMPVDADFAIALRDATQEEVVLMSDAGILASTLRAAQMPWRSRADWQRDGGSAERPSEVAIGAREFRAREIVLSENPRLSAVVLKSRDEAAEPFRRIQLGIVLIGCLCALIAAAGAVFTARTFANAQR